MSEEKNIQNKLSHAKIDRSNCKNLTTFNADNFNIYIFNKTISIVAEKFNVQKLVEEGFASNTIESTESIELRMTSKELFILKSKIEEIISKTGIINE